jgi:hypothetical protein
MKRNKLQGIDIGIMIGSSDIKIRYTVVVVETSGDHEWLRGKSKIDIWPASSLHAHHAPLESLQRRHILS